MTVFSMTLGDYPRPPTALFWPKSVGDGGPDTYVMQWMVLHMTYGIVAGLVFVSLVPLMNVGIGSMTTGVLFGLADGFVSFLETAGLRMDGVRDREPELAMAAMGSLFHLIYGVVLAAWLQLGGSYTERSRHRTGKTVTRINCPRPVRVS